MKKTVFLFLFLPCFASAFFNLFPEPDHEISIGPSFSLISQGKKIGYSFNFDLSLTDSFGSDLFYFTPSINLKQLRINNQVFTGFQTEFTVWLTVNIGGGWGYLWGDSQSSIIHLFTGLPIPLEFDPPFDYFHTFYLEPYGRLLFFDEKLYYEFGLLIKMSSFDL
ncbi:MAG: hypothetical protein A2Y41_05820 [Spirochaetes bacterium GWB1_36_13]|nr:MAG: hypothetical protein A2Y41_05820 [Spirochaetes bacterium GWB1_36_13]